MITLIQNNLYFILAYLVCSGCLTSIALQYDYYNQEKNKISKNKIKLIGYIVILFLMCNIVMPFLLIRNLMYKIFF